MGCVCCSLSTFVSIVLDALERISLCTVCALLTCCLLFTILTVLVMGIGIGYHYCFVQNSVDAMEQAAKAAGALRSGVPRADRGNMLRSVDKAVKRGFAHRVARRDIDGLPGSNNTLNSPYASNFTIFNGTHIDLNDTDTFNGTNYIFNRANISAANF